jgi:hypothetical protein
MRVAIYPSILYGADFIRESVESILPYVDKVYAVLMQRPWGNTAGVVYKNEWIPWPARFDDTRERLADLPVIPIETYKFSPWNRWGFAVELVREFCTPDEIVLIDPDCVFSNEEGELTFAEWDENPYVWAQPKQIELWRTPAWQVTRPRSMVWLARNDLALINYPDPPRDDRIERPKMQKLLGSVHNMGFCVSEQAMKWKHLTALAFAPVVNESLPNPDWFETKWLNWRPGMRDLEISIGCESGISEAVRYDTTELPMSIKKRYDAGEWARIEGVK